MNPTKEERQFDNSIEQLSEYVKNLKVSLEVFIQKVERESNTLEWNQVLDMFSTITGQINTVMRYARANKLLLGNRVVLPLLVSQDSDEELLKLTEGRVPVCNHEMVPDYLRTKPDPDIEELENSLIMKTASITPEQATKQVNAYNKLVSSLENIIASIKQSSMIDDKKACFEKSETEELVAAIYGGIGLRSAGPGMSSRNVGPVAMDTSPYILTGPSQQKVNAKAPELKTNIIKSNN